jgi:hypothetical protein
MLQRVRTAPGISRLSPSAQMNESWRKSVHDIKASCFLDKVQFAIDLRVQVEEQELLRTAL